MKIQYNKGGIIFFFTTGIQITGRRQKRQATLFFEEDVVIWDLTKRERINT